ncbi:FtsX-like permease family protein [bacterium]|nr:FtsX-like permease family protein [bacterium]
MIIFLLKGILRDRSRSLFPIMMVAAGSLLVVLLYSWMNGMFDDLIQTNARFDTGHVKVVTRAYWELRDQTPLDLALLDTARTKQELTRLDPDLIWLERIRFGGLIDVPDEQGQTRAQGTVIGLAVDLLENPETETRLLNIDAAIVQGQVPRRKSEIVISDEFAQRINIRIGDQVTLIGATMYGAMAMTNFRIAGTVRFGIPPLDRGCIIADLADVRQALDMADAATEIVGFSGSMFYDDQAMIRLSERFNKTRLARTDDFEPFMVPLSAQYDLGEFLALVRIFGAIIVSVFGSVMALVLWNSGLMNGIRRYGEIGVRLAMGEPKSTVYRRMLFESLIIGLIGSVIGTLIGLALAYLLEVYGLDFSSTMQQSQIMMSTVLRARVTGWSYLIGFFPGLIAPFLGTALAGIGIYKRQTAQLFKELEV